MLSAFDYDCAHPKLRPAVPSPPSSRRSCVARRYAQAVRMSDLPAVIALNLRAEERSLRTDDAPIFPVATQRDWGADRLLVRPTALPAPSPPPAP
jgi:hypothetical protein